MTVLNIYTAYREKYRAELDENVIAFWLKYGKDTEHGGVYTCLDKTGTLYCTDKSVRVDVFLSVRPVWLQRRLPCVC